MIFACIGWLRRASYWPATRVACGQPSLWGMLVSYRAGRDAGIFGLGVDSFSVRV